MRALNLHNAVSAALIAIGTSTPAMTMAQEGAAERTTSTAKQEEGVDAVGSSALAQPQNTAPRLATSATDLDTVTVTGTRIRGGTTPSPVITLGSERIREEGFADLGEVIRSVPQNFGGGQNPGVTGGATTGAGGLSNQNLGGGSSLNLRGLGPDASLTLLNGRRMSYGGFVQAVDISAIPIDAIERVEILPDGASAVYGSDAVGGVGNVILKRDYEGIMIGARYGHATGGGLATREGTATAGTTWTGGGLITTYKVGSTDPIYARQRDYTRHMAEPTTLYPQSKLRSGLVSAHQSIGDSLELRLDGLRTERDQTTYPYNAPHLSYHNVMIQKSEATLVAPGLTLELSNDWTLDFGAGWGKDRLVNRQTRVNHADGMRSPRSDDCYCNEVVSYEAGAEGPLFSLPAGAARVAAGMGYRRTAFAQDNRLNGTTAIEGSESTRFAYAEVSMPLVSQDMAVSGVRRLELNAAARGEDYDSFGRVTTPKIGLVYSPGADTTFKMSWGRSFKAPTLFQRYWARQTLLRPAAYFGGDDAQDAAVLLLGGGNPELEPEKARTWSASLAFHPEALPGLEAELTWFDIDYTERVVQPLTNPDQALQNPNYARFISLAPDEREQQAVIDAADIFYNLMGTPYDPAKVVAILYTNYFNVARQRIRGADLSVSNRWDLQSGRLTLRGAGSWLDSSQQSTPGEESFRLSGTLFSPAKVNGRLGAVWLQGGWSTSLFANYTGGVSYRASGGASKITSSFTTFDATVRHTFDRPAGPMGGLEFAVSAQNLLDRQPPSYIPAQIDFPPYDSTNYSAIGRFVSVSVSKRF